MIILGLDGTARLARIMRANLLDELNKPYVEMARAKGMSEWRLVLKGAFNTSEGRFGVGDMDVADDDLVHQPIIESGDECICLVLTEGPIRLQSLVARMMQPLIGL